MKLQIVILSIILLGFCEGFAAAQQDSIPNSFSSDSIIYIDDAFISAPNIIEDTSTYVESPFIPAKATMYSAVLPGLGQAYNRQYWKMPIVYAFIGGATAFLIFYQNKYNDYRRAYIEYNDQDPFTNNWQNLGLPSYYNSSQIAQTISRGRDVYRNNRDYALLAVVLTYALNVIEANVAAHLKDFNIEEDLSFRFEPTFISTPMYANSVGISLKINF